MPVLIFGLWFICYGGYQLFALLTRFGAAKLHY